MATHSSILAWKAPWTEWPGGLQSKGSQRVWSDWQAQASRLPLASLYHTPHPLNRSYAFCLPTYFQNLTQSLPPEKPFLGSLPRSTWPLHMLFPLVGLFFFLVGFCCCCSQYHRACEILVSRSGVEPMPPAVVARILNHWTAREVLFPLIRTAFPSAVKPC